MDTRFKNTDFFIEDIDESVKDLTINDSSVSHLPANTDFFIENIDNNVIEICTDRGITPTTVSVVPANTDFFIVNIDSNVKKIASDLSITPSSVQKVPANTDFFIENIYFNVILICEELNIEPYEITNTPTNTDFFIEAIAKNVEKIMEAQTEIHVSGTFIHAVLSADSEISNYELDGNATQTTYSGKNKLNYLDAVPATDQTTMSFIDNGFRSVTTATGYATKITLPVKPSTTYTLSWILKKVSGTMTPFVRVYEGTGTSTVLMAIQSATDGSYYGSFTTASGVTQVNIWFYNGTPSQGTTDWTFIQLEESATKTDYEPFVGGIPAPNPQFPMPISAVTGEQSIEVVGKNLASFTSMTEIATSQVTAVKTDNKLELTLATKSRYANMQFATGIKVKNGDTVTISAHAKSTESGVIPSYRIGKGGDTSFFSGYATATASGDGYNLEKTITADGDYELYILFYPVSNIASGDIQTFNTGTFTDFQAEYGSTATAYEPYQWQSYEVNLGNYFTSEMEQGSIGGADGLPTYSTARLRTKDFMAVEPSTEYAVSCQATASGSSINTFVFTYDENKTYIERIPANWSSDNPYIFTTGATARYIKVVFKTVPESTLVSSSITDLQLYKTANPPIELAGVGERQADGLPEYRDTIKPIDGKWYIEKQVGKVVLDGTEAWTQATAAGQIYWYVGISDSMNYTRFDSNLMSNNFTYRGENDANGFYMNAHNLIIFNHGISATTVADWKTWLSTHNTTVYYVLATPTTTEITDETLLAQLNAIYALELKEGVINISITATSPNLPASLKATIIAKE